MSFKNEALLFLSDNRGVYIPQHFAESIKHEIVTGVSEEEWEILAAGPDYEWYWDTWINVEQNARITDPETGVVYQIYNDSDCFLVPEDCDMEDFNDNHR